jgi:hypothetical protein
MDTKPVIYVTTKQLRAARVSLDQYPNAGPRCNITGMKLHYWGKNALCLKHGQYVYHVPQSVYLLFSKES